MIDPWPATIRGSPLHKRSSGALFLSVYVFLYVIVFRGRGARRHGRGGGYKRLLSSERDGGGKGKGGAEEVSNRARSSAWHKQMD